LESNTLRVIILWLFAGLLIIAAGDDNQVMSQRSIDEIGAFEAAECPFFFPSTLTVECGFVTVPEARDPDRADDSNTIRLMVAIVRSISENPAPDPVIYLDGGPGGFTLDFGDFYTNMLGGVLAERDLILFDQRGVGYSEVGLTCPEIGDLLYATLSDDLTLEDELALVLPTGLSCRERHIADGANLGTYNSAASAADVADIVRSLGYEQVNLVGVSYGTRLGLTIMRDYPQIVRSAVLDSVYPPQVNSYSQLARNADRAFSALFAACAEAPNCSRLHPDLESTFYATVERLNAEPVIVTQYDPYTEREYDVRVDGDFLINGLFSLMYSSRDLQTLPFAIDAASQGEYRRFVDNYFNDLYFSTNFVNINMYYAVDCYEEVAFETPERAAAGVEGLPDALATLFIEENTFYRDYCAAFQPETAAPFENDPVRSPIPTLLLSGQFDPITPPEWGADAAAYLPNSTHLVFPSSAHGVFTDGPCPQGIITAFITDPDAVPDTSCMDNIQPPF